MSNSPMKGTGWLRQPPDFRDHMLEPVAEAAVASSTNHILWDYFSDKVLDQGNLGSCVWNGAASMMRYERSLLGLPDFTASRLFGYYFTRRQLYLKFDGSETHGWEQIDSGCVIRDAMLVLDADGIIPEDEWPYDDGPDRFTVRPPQTLLHKALSETIDSIGAKNKDASNLRYLRIPDTSDLADPVQRLIRCLEAGHPIIAGYSLYESFDSDHTSLTGEVSIPSNDEKFVGGHLMTIVDHDPITETFVNLNSWDYDWGDRGFCHIPYEYYRMGLAVDFWTVRPKGLS